MALDQITATAFRPIEQKSFNELKNLERGDRQRLLRTAMTAREDADGIETVKRVSAPGVNGLQLPGCCNGQVRR